MGSLWPAGFERVPDAAWTREPVRELARAYDTVEQHGWYDNLDPTVDALVDHLSAGGLVMDYSGGTGILVDRLLARRPGSIGILNVDSSPKFLRLCLDKHGDDERVAMRRLPYLDEEGRLAHPHEILDGFEHAFAAIASTNAIHLYHELPATLASWRRLVSEDGRVFVQSGNVDREDRPTDRRIIDQTVDAVDQVAREMVREDERWAAYRDAVADEAWMSAHVELQERIFRPPRLAGFYEDRFREAGFAIVDVTRRSVTVDREEWTRFLQVYDQGVLGWVGGAEKVTGEAPSEEAVADRKRLIAEALACVLDGAEGFQAEWTYWTLAPG